MSGNRSRRARKASGDASTPQPSFEEAEPQTEAPGELETEPRVGGGALSIAKLVLGLGVLLSAATVVAWGAHRFLVSTARFSVEQVEVDGTRRYSDVELMSLAGIKRGANLFSLDLPASERRLASDPWIESAHIARKLPNRLTFSVKELTAAALAAVDGTLYLVTREGHPIKPLEPKDVSDYPVITGVTAEDLAEQRALAEERIAGGITLLEQYQRVAMSKAFPAQGVQLDPDGSVYMTVGVPAVTLQLGRGAFRQKLLMAGRIVGNLRSKGETPGLIFLDNEAHPERVVVRMR